MSIIINTKVNGKMVRNMEKDYILIAIKMYIQENGKITKNMEKEHMYSPKLQ
jgi:hypothetical protein